MTAANGQPLTIDKLAELKRLPADFLRGLGVRDLDHGVAIPYYGLTGEDLGTKRRTAARAGDGSFWEKGHRLAVYGLNRIESANKAGYVILVEGESDCWTLWEHYWPALGVPGSNTAKTLELEHVEAVPKIYVWREPDAGGEAFVSGVSKRLKEIGWSGSLYEISVDGVKDPSELHCLAPDEFKERFARALVGAKLLGVEDHGEAWEGERSEQPDEADPAQGDRKPVTFPSPVPISQLVAVDMEEAALLRGILYRKWITLFSSLWKAGKSTILSHLLPVTHNGGEVFGLPIKPCKVLLISEEPDGLWPKRRDQLGIQDNVHVMSRPLKGKPNFSDWNAFLSHLGTLTRQGAFGLIVIDTLPSFWPVVRENEASEVTAAMLPLRNLADTGPAIQLMHHNRKSDGLEATAARGSGALMASVDVIVEFRRYSQTDRKDRRRVLTGYGRIETVPDELVVKLSEDGRSYTPEGDRQQSGKMDRLATMYLMLPDGEQNAVTVDELFETWSRDERPSKRTVAGDLRDGANVNKWHQRGTGKKGDPFRYWKD